jgi:hypothetical protein
VKLETTRNVRVYFNRGTCALWLSEMLTLQPRSDPSFAWYLTQLCVFCNQPCAWFMNLNYFVVHRLISIFTAASLFMLCVPLCVCVCVCVCARACVYAYKCVRYAEWYQIRQPMHIDFLLPQCTLLRLISTLHSQPARSNPISCLVGLINQLLALYTSTPTPVRNRFRVKT